MGGWSATQCTAPARPSGFRSAHRDRQASVGPLGGMVSRMAWTQRTLGCRWAGGGVGFTAVALGRSSCSGGHLLRDQQRHGSGSRSRGRGAVDSGRGQPRSLSTAAAASIPGPGGVAQSGNRPAVGIRGQHRAHGHAHGARPDHELPGSDATWVASGCVATQRRSHVVCALAGRAALVGAAGCRAGVV